MFFFSDNYNTKLFELIHFCYFFYFIYHKITIDKILTNLFLFTYTSNVIKNRVTFVPFHAHMGLSQKFYRHARSTPKLNTFLSYNPWLPFSSSNSFKINTKIDNILHFQYIIFYYDTWLLQKYGWYFAVGDNNREKSKKKLWKTLCHIMTF